MDIEILFTANFGISGEPQENIHFVRVLSIVKYPSNQS